MPNTVGLIRRALPLVSVVVLAAVLYDGWILYSRWSAARQARLAGEQEEARRARQTIDLIGGTDFRIINFYASPQAISRGSHGKLCYGVYGAKRVRIEPRVEDLKPAISYCFEVAPRQTTEYKLIAEDDAGHTVSANLALKVAP